MFYKSLSVSLLALSCGLTACGGSSKKSPDPQVPVQDQKPKDETGKPGTVVEGNTGNENDGTDETNHVNPPQPTQQETEQPKVPEHLIGSWQSQLRDGNHAGNITYTFDKDGRLQVSLLVYSRSQKKVLAERQEWSGRFNGIYRGVRTKDSCGESGGSLTLKVIAGASDDTLQLTDVTNASSALPLDRIKGGLNADVYAATEIHGLPVVEGCFTNGQLSRFIPALSSQDIPKAAETLAPTKSDFTSLKDLCVEAFGKPGSDLDFTIRLVMADVFQSNVWKTQAYAAAECETLSQAAAKQDSLWVRGEGATDGHILDGRVFSGFGKLQDVIISRGRWAQTEALGELKGLTALVLSGSTFDDLSFVKRLPKLQSITYMNAPILKLAELSNPFVETIAVSNNPNLKELGNGGITSLGDGAEFPALKTLMLNRQPLESLKGIGSFKSLETLSLQGTPVKDLSPLNDLTYVRVYMPPAFDGQTCPVFLGECSKDKTPIYGSVFGTETPGSQSFQLQQKILPALGKILAE